MDVAEDSDDKVDAPTPVQPMSPPINVVVAPTLVQPLEVVIFSTTIKAVVPTPAQSTPPYHYGQDITI